MPRHALFTCTSDVTLRSAAGRLVADGWVITYRDDTTLQLAPRVVTTRDDQVNALIRRGGMERERMRLTVVHPIDSHNIQFRADVEVTTIVPPAPPVRAEILLDNLVDASRMSEGMRMRLNALHLAVCGTPDFFPKPRPYDISAAR